MLCRMLDLWVSRRFVQSTDEESFIYKVLCHRGIQQMPTAGTFYCFVKECLLSTSIGLATSKPVCLNLERTQASDTSTLSFSSKSMMYSALLFYRTYSFVIPSFIAVFFISILNIFNLQGALRLETF